MAEAESRPGYMGTDILGCQFSVYPLRQPDLDRPIRAAIQAARGEGCSVRVGNLSTLLSGSEDQVFRGLRAAFRAAQHFGPAVVTAALTAGMPTDDLVGEIQREIATKPAGTASTAPGRPSTMRGGRGASRGDDSRPGTAATAARHGGANPTTRS